MLKHRKVVVSEWARAEVNKALEQGELTMGPYIEKVEEKMREITGCKYAVAVSTGTMALQLALEAAMQNIEINGENPMVAVPDFSFVVDASVPSSLGWDIFFVDVERNSLVIQKQVAEMMDVDIVLAVHMAGVEAPKFDIPVVYDSAHRIGRCPGVTSIFSFHPSKIISGIEGGCITTDDVRIYEFAKKMRCFGFENGERYIEDGAYGYKGMMSNIQAIVIYSNLLQIVSIMQRRQVILEMYNSAFGLQNEGLGMYMVPVKDPDDAVLRNNGFVRHYPRTLSRQFHGTFVMQGNSKYACDHLISVPFHENLTYEEITHVIQLLEGKILHY